MHLQCAERQCASFLIFSSFPKLTFYFGIILVLQRSCKDSTASPEYPSPGLPPITSYITVAYLSLLRGREWSVTTDQIPGLTWISLVFPSMSCFYPWRPPSGLGPWCPLASTASLCFMTRLPQKVLVGGHAECPPVWVCLMFPSDYTGVMGLGE